MSGGIMIAILATLAPVAGATPEPQPVTTVLAEYPDTSVTLAFPKNGPAIVSLARAGKIIQKKKVASPRDALIVLADRRLSSFWEPLLAWAGPGLERLRNIRVSEARAIAANGATMIARSTIASSVRPPTRAVLLLSDELWKAGQREEAFRIVSDARGASPGKGDWGRAEWGMTTLRLASFRRARGDVDGALTILTDGEPPIAGSPYVINFLISRAAILAEAGRYAEALPLVDVAQEKFEAERMGGNRKLAVPGSRRQFDWIRACALVRLGRQKEAAPFVASLVSSPTPRDRDFFVDTTEQIQLRYARCAHDAGLAAKLYADDLSTEPLGGAALRDLQPALRDPDIDAAFNERLRRDPVLRPFLLARMREVPPDLIPALNMWRQ